MDHGCSLLLALDDFIYADGLTVEQCFGYIFDATKQEDEKIGNGECQPLLKKEWSDLPIYRIDESVASACGQGGHGFISSPRW